MLLDLDMPTLTADEAVEEFVRGTAGTDGLARPSSGLAILYARAAGDGRDERRALVRLSTCLVLGPTHVREALSRWGAITAGLADARGLLAMAQAAKAELVAMQGDFAEARRLYTDSKEVLLDVGNKVYAAGVALYAGPIELLAGEPEAATLLHAAAQIGDQRLLIAFK